MIQRAASELNYLPNHIAKSLVSRETKTVGRFTLQWLPRDDMEVTLISPIAMDDGLRFAIREGGRTVGAGVVTKIIE